jgi:hypothetical protein
VDEISTHVLSYASKKRGRNAIGRTCVLAGRDLHGELEGRVVLERRVGRAAAGGETGDPLGGDAVDAGGSETGEEQA